MVKLTLIENNLEEKRNVVYRPTARVPPVLELLQSHGRMMGAGLARRLEVDIRTARSTSPPGSLSGKIPDHW